MKSKQLLLVFFCAAMCSIAHCQTVRKDLNYRKFRIFVDAGLDYSKGKSGTLLPLSYAGNWDLPSSSKGNGAGFDGAYFLTKQYGVGLKYRYFKADNEQFILSEYEDVENKYDYPILQLKTDLFREQTHIFGPAVYARWFLGQSKWNVSTNAGVVFLYNKLSKVKKNIVYHQELDPNRIYSQEELLFSLYYVLRDHTGTTVGFTLSAGIRYQLTSAIGIGVSANGLFASLSKMKLLNYFEEYETADISRKVNRIGFSAGIDFNF